MSRVIWKYHLDLVRNERIRMPKGSDILSFKIQNNRPTIWVMVDTEETEEVEEVFNIVGTGYPIEIADHTSLILGYIESVQYGDLVWHLFKGEFGEA